MLTNVRRLLLFIKTLGDLFSVPTAQKSTLQKHSRAHTAERPFKSSQCRKAVDKNQLFKNTCKRSKRDVREHSKATIVQRLLVAILNQHLLTHSGKRPFKCPECSKSYQTKYHLQRHFSSHSGE